jgi:hypothetical protein
MPAYETLSVEAFGRQLIQTGDLDPVYIALQRMAWSEEQRDRWLLSYLLCYHPGAACWLSEQEGQSFWDHLDVAARNETLSPAGTRWPRAAERRHWRGKTATESVTRLRGCYEDASDFVNYCCGGKDGWSNPEPYRLVASRVKEHYAFGDWVSYKFGDIAERVLGVPVLFTWEDAMYESPNKAALELWREHMKLPDNARPKDINRAVRDVVEHLLDLYKDYDAPGGDRKIGLTEVETILCKHLSHKHGHYPLNNDLVEISHGCQTWQSVSPTVAEFLRHFPKV